MAKSLASLRRVTADTPPLTVLYGVHGWGKTTLGAEFHKPVFMQFEQGTPGGAEFDSFGEMETFEDGLDGIGALLTGEHDYKTLVVDSIDAMEPLIWRKVCEEKGWPDVEHGTDGKSNFGKGYIAVDAPWRDFLGGCKALTASGIGVVLIAHSDITRFDSPTTDPYSRYGIKLQKRAAALVQEAADVVAFCNYRVTIKSAEVGPKREVRHGVGGGSRVLYFQEMPGFLAKNRYQMPDSIDYVKGKGYLAMAEYFPKPTGIGAVQQQAAE